MSSLTNFHEDEKAFFSLYDLLKVIGQNKINTKYKGCIFSPLSTASSGIKIIIFI